MAREIEKTNNYPEKSNQDNDNYYNSDSNNMTFI